MSANVQENNVNGVAITLAGSDPEGRSLTYHVVTQPTKGTLSLINGNVITYTPYNWHDGADSFQYVVNDGTQDSAQATVPINIQNVWAKTTSRIVVITLFEDGKTYSGLSTTLSQGGTTINSGFTQVHFQVNNGQNYSVNVPASGSKGTFVQWDSGSTSTSRSFNISQDTPVFAFYRR